MKNYNLFTLHSWQSQAGQIVLILVLVTVVGLTIGLSLISRTVTDVRISSQIEQSNRAFSAAEAGVESALKGAVVGGPTGTVNISGDNISANYNVTALGGQSSVYLMPNTVANSTQTVWMTGHNDDESLNENISASYPANSSIDICFGTGTTKPAIIITVLYKDGTDYKNAKAAYDSNPGGRTPSNNFASVDSIGEYCGGNFLYKKTVNFSDLQIPGTAILLTLRLQPLYENTPLAVKPADNVNLPVQGKMITSVGKTNTGVVRKIQVNQGYAVLPVLLDYTLFTEN